MKKMLLTAVVALMTLSANAQVFLGGEVGAWRNPTQNETQFSIQPEVGYVLSDKWALGVAVGYEYNYLDGTKVNSVGVNPYARYTFAKFGPVSVFADGGFEFATQKVKGYDAATVWGVGIKPGVAVNLTEKLSFVSHIGFLGYRDSNDYAIHSNDGFGFNLDGNELTFGLYYNF
ncbi:MAG: outer membrane beta-barrel protein [Bacteroidaceae bacterium]|nr:outer membrane beta-barrel protein [Bacteroidaceae bacterium]